MHFGTITPILRIFDETKAREFYVGFLGFDVRFEHRFEDNMPLYLEVAKDDCVLHLSEHHGDCSPGAAIRIRITGLEDFHRQLARKKYKYGRPGIADTPWRTREMSVWDPFGNKLIFVDEKVRQPE